MIPSRRRKVIAGRIKEFGAEAGRMRRSDGGFAYRVENGLFCARWYTGDLLFGVNSQDPVVDGVDQGLPRHAAAAARVVGYGYGKPARPAVLDELFHAA